MPAPTYTAFPANKNYQVQAKNAFNEVRLLLGKANSALVKLKQYQPGQTLETNDQREADRFVRWFAPFTPANINNVRDNVIYPMVRQLETLPVTIQCGGPLCQPNWYAYVTAPGGGLGAGITIFLCNKFFTAPQYGKDSQVGTLLHEISHLVGTTHDHQYGQDNCLTLATTNPAQAMDNADNYEYYLESFHYT